MNESPKESEGCVSEMGWREGGQGTAAWYSPGGAEIVECVWSPECPVSGKNTPEIKLSFPFRSY